MSKSLKLVIKIEQNSCAEVCISSCQIVLFRNNCFLLSCISLEFFYSISMFFFIPISFN